MKKIAAAVLMSAAVAAPVYAADAQAAPAAAADNGFYMGVNAGVSTASHIFQAKPSKANGGLFSLLGGYQFNKNFATELQYAYLGKAEYNTLAPTATVKTHSFGLNGVGILPVSDAFGLYGKFGLAFNTSSVSNMPAGAGVDGKTHFGTTVGLGVQYNVVPSFGLRAGWDRYDAALKATGASDNYFKSTWSVGGLYRF